MTAKADEPVKGNSLWADAWRRLLKNRAAIVSFAIIVVISLIAIAYPLVSRYVTHFTIHENHNCLRYEPPGMRGVPREYPRFFSERRHAFADVDTDNDGHVTVEELSAMLRRIEFAHLDRNGNGSLNARELKRAPRSFLTDDYDELVAGFDVNNSGAVDLDEAESFVDIFPYGEAGVFVRRYDGDISGGLSASEFPGVPKPQRFWMGTDSLGRDVATRVVYGARISLMVGLLATLVSLLIGVTYGAVAGYFGGRVDAVMMRIVDIIYGLPYMFLVILLMVIFGRSIFLIFVAIGAVTWLTMARIVRGQVLSLKSLDFVQAARSLGVSHAGIVFRHLIPNALGPIIIYATLTVPAVMLQEAFLSFLGLGVQAPMTSWGALASEGASPGVMTNYPWLILFPGGAFAVTLFALNFLGDGLRDALDPRVRKD